MINTGGVKTGLFAYLCTPVNFQEGYLYTCRYTVYYTSGTMTEWGMNTNVRNVHNIANIQDCSNVQ